MNDLNDMDNIPKNDKSSELKDIQAMRIESQKKSKVPKYAIAIGAVVGIGAIGAALICESGIIEYIRNQFSSTSGIASIYTIQEQIDFNSESITLGNLTYESDITSD